LDKVDQDRLFMKRALALAARAAGRRFLKDDILLATLVNPDGMDLVSDWYMREPVKENRSTSGVPRLYQKYAGHDNNRDSYMASQPETQAVDSILYRAWYPQIVYNHHQTAPAGTVISGRPLLVACEGSACFATSSGG
jgi:hypothetical protein